MHGSYLQGMETIVTNYTYDNLTGTIARILPTRNGNKSSSSPPPPAYLGKHGSYLQGMETADGQPRLWGFAVVSTDPTYKEWKLLLPYPSWQRATGTDPTYKEWKRPTSRESHSAVKGTDPTYKEWKLFDSLDV